MQEWAKSMEINVASMVMMAKYAIPEMEKNEGQWRGSIVNIASVAGIRGGNPHLLYPTSKGAVVNMTRAMAVHHGPQGIRVNCVCPGQSSFFTFRRCPLSPDRLRLSRDGVYPNDVRSWYDRGSSPSSEG